MAGYQDGALNYDGQKYSIPALLSKQFELVGGGSFNQPFIPDNLGLGINPKLLESDYQHASNLRYKTDCEGVTSLSPVKEIFSISSAGLYLQHLSGSFQNLSVPFALTISYGDPYLGVKTGNPTVLPGFWIPYYARFSSNPGGSTVLSDAVSQNPTFFSLWAGMEDIYWYARTGGEGPSPWDIIGLTQYWYFNLDSILTPLTQNGAKGVIANIPDLTSFPFYTLIPWNGLELTQSQADSLNMITTGIFNFQEGKNGFVIADTSDASGYRKMVDGEYILLTAPLDSIRCNFLGAFDALPDGYVLDTSEVRIINQLIAGYNIRIASKAQEYNLALADMNAFFKTVVSGIKWDGVDFDAEFVSGGFYSLDGFHPNQKGYAIIANEFIKAINSKYNSTLPWVNCAECSGIKFP